MALKTTSSRRAAPPARLLRLATGGCSAESRVIWSSPPGQHETPAAVLGPCCFARPCLERPLFAGARRLDSYAVDAERRQVRGRHLGAAVAEGEVVLLRAALVAMSFDPDPILRILVQPCGRLAQCFLRFRVERRRVEGEERVPDPAALASDPACFADVLAQDLARICLGLHEI